MCVNFVESFGTDRIQASLHNISEVWAPVSVTKLQQLSNSLNNLSDFSSTNWQNIVQFASSQLTLSTVHIDNVLRDHWPGYTVQLSTVELSPLCPKLSSHWPKLSRVLHSGGGAVKPVIVNTPCSTAGGRGHCALDMDMDQRVVSSGKTIKTSSKQCGARDNSVD